MILKAAGESLTLPCPWLFLLSRAEATRGRGGRQWGRGLCRWDFPLLRGWQIPAFTTEGAMALWLRGAGWSPEFANKVPIQGKAHKIPRRLGSREAVLSDIENRFRAQSGHKLFVILYHWWEEPTFFSLPIIILISLCFYLSGCFQVLALSTLSDQCGCREHELILISA